MHDILIYKHDTNMTNMSTIDKELNADEDYVSGSYNVCMIEMCACAREMCACVREMCV